jgi:hypothetical protein
MRSNSGSNFPSRPRPQAHAAATGAHAAPQQERHRAEDSSSAEGDVCILFAGTACICGAQLMWGWDGVCMAPQEARAVAAEETAAVAEARAEAAEARAVEAEARAEAAEARALRAEALLTIRRGDGQAQHYRRLYERLRNALCPFCRMALLD